MYSNGYRGSSSGAETELMSFIQHLNLQELEKLSNDEDEVTRLVNDHAQIKEHGRQREKLLEKNKSIADINLSREIKFLELRTMLTNQFTIQKEMREKIDNAQLQLNGKERVTSIDTMQALLETESAKAEEQSEETAEKFLGGSLSVDDFLEQFSSQRSLYHLRKAKSTKLRQKIHAMNSAPAESNVSGNTGYPTAGYPLSYQLPGQPQPSYPHANPYPVFPGYSQPRPQPWAVAPVPYHPSYYNAKHQ